MSSTSSSSCSSSPRTNSVAATVRSLFHFLTSPRHLVGLRGGHTTTTTHALTREAQSQSSSGVSSSRLSDIASSDEEEEADEEGDEEELRARVRVIVNDFLSTITYTPPPSPPPSASGSTLVERIIARTSSWVDHTGEEERWRQVCVQSAAMANMSYGGHRFEVQEQIALFTWFMIYIDDTASHNPTRLLHFQQTLLFPTSPSTSPFSSSTSSHSDPILHHFALHLNNMYTFYNPISANCIITATLEFITGCVLETQNNITTMPLHRPTMTGHQNLYPYYLRSKTGVAPAYAFMMFPKEENPNMEVYLEVIPELCLFIDKTNDVLSFYKEELAGETLNYIHNRARCATPSSSSSSSSSDSATEESLPRELVYGTLRDVAEEASANAKRISDIMRSAKERGGGEGAKAEEAWNVFKDGYVEFHMSQTRYMLDQVGLKL